uniref:Uncharacterized protein n=1 Tax=Odontella aurita TaxID=265563 RepID=A0A7S4IST2_9STRA
MSIFNAHDEDTGKKTWTRKLVESTLSKFKWYNPQRDDPDAPSLSKAWTYYEHVTLARRLLTCGDGYRRAEPGDTAQTALYSLLKTPESALSEWGIGVALYFSTVRVMAGILLVAGVINIAMIIYYAGDRYDSGGSKDELYMVLLRGTAICTDQEWVVCDDSCTRERWEKDLDEFATGVDPVTGEELTFVMRNMCSRVQLAEGMVSYGSLFFIAFCFFLLGWYQHIQENWLDEDNVMSSDYTVRVSNPPKDSYDAEKWKGYFEKFTKGNVTAVTIALDNAKLLSALVQRRFFTEQLRLRLSGDVDMDDPSEVEETMKKFISARDAKKIGILSEMLNLMITSAFSPFGKFLSAEKLKERIELWTKKVQDAQKEKYNVVQVYVTFEMQSDQRLALEATTVSKIDSLKKHVGAVDPNVLFDGKVLHVSEPKGPSTIRWLDLQVSTRKKVGLWLFTFFVIGCMMAVADQVFRPARDLSIYFYSFCVSAVDVFIPDIVFALLSLEKHDHEGSFQMSLYLKITVFRIFIIVIVPVLITPSTHALGTNPGDLLVTTNALLFSACLARPVYHLVDPYGTFRKHVLGPRATTQEMMNLNFMGTTYHLGERYTDMTKIIILNLFYSPLDPRAFFIGAVGLFIQYCVDKFCLMRLWATAPFIKTRLSRAFRTYFYATAVMVMAVMSARAFAMFPYDNICDSESPTGGFSGKYNATLPDGSLEEINVFQDNQVIFCQQSLSKLEQHFPAVPSVQKNSQGEWMDPSQEKLTRIYGWTSFVIVIAYAVIGFIVVLGTEVKSIYKKKGPKRQDQDNLIDFNTENLGVQAYIPHVIHPAFDFPLLACDIDEMDQKLIGWNDPIHSYDFHNLIFDVPWPGMNRTKRILTCTRGAATLSRHKDYEAEETDRTATFSTEKEKEASVHLSQESKEPRHERPIFSILKYYASNGIEQAMSPPRSNRDVNRSSSVRTVEKEDHHRIMAEMPSSRIKAAESLDIEKESDLPFTQEGKFGSWSGSCEVLSPSLDSFELIAPSRSMDRSELKSKSKGMDDVDYPTTRNESGWKHEQGWENEVEVEPEATQARGNGCPYD